MGKYLIIIITIIIALTISAVVTGNESTLRTYGNDGLDSGGIIIEYSHTQYLILGTYEGNQPDHFLIIRIVDINGQVIESIQFPEYSLFYYENFGHCIEASDGGFLIVTSIFVDKGDSDLLVLKIDDSLNEEWNFTFGGPFIETGHYVSAIDDGGYIITGKRRDANESSDLWLLRLTQNGTILWNKTFGDSEDNEGLFAKQAPSGNIVVGGLIKDTVDYTTQAWLLLVDIDGVEKWNKTYRGRISWANSNPILIQPNGTFVLSFSHETKDNNYRSSWLLQFNENGSEIKKENLHHYEGLSIYASDDEGILTFVLSRSGDILLLKLNEKWNIEWTWSSELIKQDKRFGFGAPNQLDAEISSESIIYVQTLDIFDNDWTTDIAFISLSILDDDKDSYPNLIDRFPNNPREWNDTDNDGVGDNGDEFPNDPSEWKDSDNDGVGDNDDILPNVKHIHSQWQIIVILMLILISIICTYLYRKRIRRKNKRYF